MPSVGLSPVFNMLRGDPVFAADTAHITHLKGSEIYSITGLFNELRIWAGSTLHSVCWGCSSPSTSEKLKASVIMTLVNDIDFTLRWQEFNFCTDGQHISRRCKTVRIGLIFHFNFPSAQDAFEANSSTWMILWTTRFHMLRFYSMKCWFYCNSNLMII